MSNLPDVPGVPKTLDRSIRTVLESLREHVRELRGFGGNADQRAVTSKEYVSGGGGTTVIVPGGPGGGGTTPDYTPPPQVSGGSVGAGIDFLFYETDAPIFTQGNGYGRTRVYGAKWPASDPTAPTFSEAVLIDEFVGRVGNTATDPATRWCIWLKWVTRDGIESVDPAGGTNGFQATTGQDVELLLEALQGMLRNEQLDPTSNFRFKANLFTIESTSGTPAINPFTVVTTPTLTPAGELLPVGVYMEAAYVKNLEAALGRFQNAFITNAMIVSVSASRITSGVISVGNYIQSSNYVPGVSGWRIHGDGSAELAAAVIRGQLTAAQIDSRGLTIRKADGTIILDAGASVPIPSNMVNPAADWLNANIAQVSLVNSANTLVNGTTVTKVSGSGADWDAGFYSKDAFSGGAYVSFVPALAGHDVGVGLNDDASADSSYLGIAFWVYCSSDGTLVPFVNGVAFGTFSTWTPGDVLAVSYDGVVARWFKNGTLMWSRSEYPGITAPLYADGTFRTIGGKVTNIQFGPLSNNLWSSVGGSGKPQDNATVGATIGTNLSGAFNQTSWDVVMSSALIRASHIQNLSVGLLSTAINGGATGDRIEITTNKITVFGAGVPRVRIGDLS